MTDTPRRRTRDELLADLADAVAELTQPYTHTEQYRIRKKNYYLHRHHQSSHASLLDQLRECVTDRPLVEGEQDDRATPRNTARIDLDAIDRLDAIKRRVAEWRDVFGMEPRGKKAAQDLLWHTQEITRLFPPPLPRPIAQLRTIAATYAIHIAGLVEPDLKAVVGQADGADTGTLVQFERDVGRYSTWCRIVAGWQKPALQPRANCPQCDLPVAERQGLRVRAEIPAAVCLSCDTTWEGPAELAVLGEHIRQIREAVDAERQALEQAPPTSEHQNRGGRG